LIYVKIVDISERDSFYDYKNIKGTILKVDENRISSQGDGWFSMYGKIVYGKISYGESYLKISGDDSISFFQVKYKEIEKAIMEI